MTTASEKELVMVWDCIKNLSEAQRVLVNRLKELSQAQELLKETHENLMSELGLAFKEISDMRDLQIMLGIKR